MLTTLSTENLHLNERMHEHKRRITAAESIRNITKMLGHGSMTEMRYSMLSDADKRLLRYAAGLPAPREIEQRLADFSKKEEELIHQAIGRIIKVANLFEGRS